MPDCRLSTDTVSLASTGYHRYLNTAFPNSHTAPKHTVPLNHLHYEWSKKVQHTNNNRTIDMRKAFNTQQWTSQEDISALRKSDTGHHQLFHHTTAVHSKTEKQPKHSISHKAVADLHFPKICMICSKWLPGTKSKFQFTFLHTLLQYGTPNTLHPMCAYNVCLSASDISWTWLPQLYKLK